MKTVNIAFFVMLCLFSLDSALARNDGPPPDWPKGKAWRQEWENHVKPHLSGRNSRTIITYPSYYYYNPYSYPSPYYTPPPVTYQQPIFPIQPPTNASVSSYYDTDGMIVHYYIDPKDAKAYYYSNDASGNMQYFYYDTNGNKVYYTK